MHYIPSACRLCKLGEGCVEDNGLSDRITLIAAHSDDIEIGSDPGQLPAKVDVIVSELVDSGTRNLGLAEKEGWSWIGGGRGTATSAEMKDGDFPM